MIRRFGLTSLLPSLQACESLSGGESPLDVAVLGQFKSGKSSLLNAVLGEAVFPVGALPVTAVVTRVAGGSERTVRVALHKTRKIVNLGKIGSCPSPLAYHFGQFLCKAVSTPPAESVRVVTRLAASYW